jgi:hypothetical protein
MLRSLHMSTRGPREVITKIKRRWPFDRLPPQIEGQIRHALFFAIDLTRGQEKLRLIGLKDRFEVDFIAIFSGSSTHGCR